MWEPPTEGHDGLRQTWRWSVVLAGIWVGVGLFASPAFALYDPVRGGRVQPPSWTARLAPGGTTEICLFATDRFGGLATGGVRQIVTFDEFGRLYLLDHSAGVASGFQFTWFPTRGSSLGFLETTPAFEIPERGLLVGGLAADRSGRFLDLTGRAGVDIGSILGSPVARPGRSEPVGWGESRSIGEPRARFAPTSSGDPDDSRSLGAPGFGPTSVGASDAAEGVGFGTNQPDVSAINPLGTTAIDAPGFQTLLTTAMLPPQPVRLITIALIEKVPARPAAAAKKGVKRLPMTK